MKKARLWLDTALAAISGVLGLLTLVTRDWIEGLTGWDPDHHNGSAEWLIVAGLLLIAFGLGLHARRRWRGWHAAQAPAR